MLGSEVYANGVAKLLAEIDRKAQLRQYRAHIFTDDARLLVASLADRSIARAFILFPDPWPKERHKKRRLVAASFLDELARVLIDGAELRLATDDMDYARADARAHHRPRIPRFPLARAPKALGDWRERPADWPPTRYEQKAIAAGRKPLYLRFARR